MLTQSQLQAPINANTLLNTTTDCLHFVTEFFEVISQSTSHIYHSALPLTPQSSIVQKLYNQHIYSPMVRVLTGIPASWDSCIASVGYENSNNCAIWSPCGQLVVAAFDTNIQIHKLNTLERVSTLTSPHDRPPFPTCFTFSPGGHLLACSFVQYNQSDGVKMLHNYSLVLWDIQTGVVIWKVDTLGCGKVMFHGNQKAITLVLDDGGIHTYNALDGAELYPNDIPLSLGPGSATCWVHEETLQFAISLKTDGQHVISIKEFQPTSTLPLHTLSSFPIPPYDGQFSFSPVSFHASFATLEEVVVLNVQDSKVLLQTKVTQVYGGTPGEFSSNGCFFACGISEDTICVWQNTSTGYVPWSSLRYRLPFDRFLFSPAATLILCYGDMGIELLHLGNHPSPQPPPEVDPYHQPKTNHQVVYSRDQMYVAAVRQWGSIVTVVDCLFGTTQQFICPDMEIHDIKFVDNTLFAVGRHKLVCWDLEVDGVVDSVVKKMLAIESDVRHLTLSPDCSQIAFIRGQTVFLHDLKAPGPLAQYVSVNLIQDVQFSPDQHKLWVLTYTKDNAIYHPDGGEGFCPIYWHVELVITEGGGFGDATIVEGKPSLWEDTTSCEYLIKGGWVVDSGGKELLWLPPNWRRLFANDMEWNGNFLALVSWHHPEAIIVHFHP